MSDDRRQLNQFIIDRFTDEELRILCAVEFREVYDDFSDGWGKKRKVMELIGWCERNAEEEKLLSVLQRACPQRFAKKDFSSLSSLGDGRTTKKRGKIARVRHA